MLDHLIVRVSDLARSRCFYEKALITPGLRCVLEFPDGVAFRHDWPELGLAVGISTHSGLHAAFCAPDRAAVAAFHHAALAVGGLASGHPGRRTEYHPD